MSNVSLLCPIACCGITSVNRNEQERKLNINTTMPATAVAVADTWPNNVRHCLSTDLRWRPNVCHGSNEKGLKTSLVWKQTYELIKNGTCNYPDAPLEPTDGWIQRLCPITWLKLQDKRRLTNTSLGKISANVRINLRFSWSLFCPSTWLYVNTNMDGNNTSHEYNIFMVMSICSSLSNDIAANFGKAGVYAILAGVNKF